MRNLSNKYVKQLLHTAVKTRLDALNTASKKVVQKVAEKKNGRFYRKQNR